MVQTNTNKNNRQKNIIFYKQDDVAVSKIKDFFGLATESQAIRLAVRNYMRFIK